MAVDLAVVGLQVDTSQVERAGEVVGRTFASMADGAEKAQAAAANTGRALGAQAAAQGQAASSTQRLNETLQQLNRLQREVAIATEMREELEKQTAAGQKVRASLYVEAIEIQKKAIADLSAARQAAWARDGALARLEAEAYAENARRVAVASKAKREAEVSTRKFGNALQTLSLAAIGLPGPLGRVISSLSALALGGGVAVGVSAGVSAIVAVWEHLTRESREARQRVDELVASLARAEKVRLGVQLREDLGSVVQRVREATAEVEKFARLSTYTMAPGINAPYTTDSKAYDEAFQRLVAAIRARNNLQAEGWNEEQRQRKQADDDRRRADDEARRQFEQRRSELQQIAKLERDVALARAEASGNASAINRQHLESGVDELEEQLEAMKQLSAAERDRYRQAGLLLLSLQSQHRTLQSIQEVTERIGTRVDFREMLRENIAEGDAREKFSQKVKENLDKGWAQLVKDLADQAEREMEQRYQAALRTTTDAFQRGFNSIFENGIKGFADFFDAVAGLARQAAASIAATMTIRALGIDDLLKRLVDPKTAGEAWQLGRGFQGRGALAGNAIGGFLAGQIGGQLGASQSSGFNAAAVGALSGAAGGFAVGGPVGAIVGGVTGMVSGLIGQGNRAKEAARALAEAQKNFDTAMDSYIASIRGDQLAQALAGNTATVDALKKQAEEIARAQIAELSPEDLKNGRLFEIIHELQVTMADIEQASAEMVAKLKEEAEFRKAQAAGDLQVRLLRAQGQDEQAAAMDRQLQREREIRQARLDGMDAEYLALLTQVQLAEELALQLAETQRIAAVTSRLNDDLSVRELRAAGEDEGAERLRRQIEAQREYNQALEDGVDAATLARLSAVHLAEAQKWEADQAKMRAQQVGDFRLNYLERRATLDGDAEGLRYVRAARLKQRQDEELEAAQKLVDAGELSMAEYRRFEALLKDEFAAALDETAIAAEEAARKMRDAVAHLNQEFQVFETGLEDQISQMGDLFGFSGKSKAELQDLYTTIAEAGAGGLTEEQKRLNDQIADYLGLVQRFEAEQARSETTPVSTRSRTVDNGTVYAGEINLSIEIHVDADDLRDTERLAERIASRINREFGGRASLLKGAAGRP